MMRIIENCQTRSQLCLRIDPQQDLARELIAGGCSGLPKGNVEDIPIGVIGDAGCSHRFSPPVPKDLVSKRGSGLMCDILKIFGHFIETFLQFLIVPYASFHPSNAPTHTRRIHLQDFRYRLDLKFSVCPT